MIAEPSFSLSVIDLTALPEPAREAEGQRLVGEAATRPFDIERGPLFRAALLRLGERAHLLSISMHHVISDGWSFGVLTRELGALYEAFSAGRPSPLAELPIQLVDHALWQRQWLSEEALAEQIAYWKAQLGGAPPVLELPTDHPHSAARSARSESQTLVLPPELGAALRRLGRERGVTLFMTLLAAFQVLLSRHTGQDDLCVGTPFAGRTRAELEPLIGAFINTLVLRTRLSAELPFTTLLERVRETTLEAFAHPDVPFDRLVEAVQPERRPGRTPLFQVLFNMLDAPAVWQAPPGLSAQPVETADVAPRFDLTLYVHELAGEIHLHLVYPYALFSAERMVCLLGQMRYLLDQIVEAPGDEIGSYSLVDPASRLLLPDPSALLAEPRHPLVADTIAGWAARSPDQPAIRQGGRSWTYAVLDARARAIARALLNPRLGRAIAVAVTGPRSFGLVAAMLGVLLAGGRLVTLDPRLPEGRRRAMLEIASATHLLQVGGPGDDAWLDAMPSLARVDVDAAEGTIPAPGGALEHAPLPVIEPDDAAYVFFTSGSTGTPKGVLGCHKGLSHFLTWQRDTFGVGPGNRTAQLTGLSFNVVLRDVFLPLVSGTTLVLPDEDAPPPDRLFTWMDREAITLLHTVPALARAWLADVPAGVSLRSLRWVFFAGEPLTDTLVASWRRTFPAAGAIVNLYGPTETTLAKFFFRVPGEPFPGVPADRRALAQTQGLVLSPAGRLAAWARSARS